MMDELPADKLRRTCDPTLMHCATTEELTPLEEIIGQERAVKALHFGLDIERPGFNVYAAGYPGTGRTTAVTDFLEEVAKTKPTPSDWCYVNNFQNEYEPRAISFPPGTVKAFQTAIGTLIAEVRRALPKAFDSEEYASQRDTTVKAIEAERNELFAQLNQRAQEEGFVLQIGPTGLLIIPAVKGKPLTQQQFLALTPPVREEILKRRAQLDADLGSAMRQLRASESRINDAVNALNREVAVYAIGHLFANLKEQYAALPEVIMYLEEVQRDVLANLAQFLKPETPEAAAPPLAMPWMREPPSRKYEVNVIVDNAALTGAPVVLELNPTYQNLFGRIEKEAQFGVLSTDFTMIREGSLHKANGGYLVLPVEELLQNLFTWEGLKRALRNREIVVEEAGERLGFITTKGLRPEALPLAVKVILIGNPNLYQLLYALDKDFKELFKVKADFDTAMERTDENMQQYAAFICTFCSKEGLKHLDASGVAKVIEYGSRLAEDQHKLSTRFADVADVVQEACFYAAQDAADYVAGRHVTRAIEEKLYRSNLIQERLREMMERGIILINTEGAQVGQINGLSVMSMGDFAFGAPSRVTASIGLGREGIIDIQREAQLAGPIHTKGVMILSGYLAEKYAQDKPLSLAARLVFEQSYGFVEGDSASSTELYALLSALAERPIRQDVAVTGSVNQKGEVQAIGGVNEKIEGFYEVCKAKGLTGHNGVLIPASNVDHLMLKEEVVDAVQAGRFHIYPVPTIDHGIELLTGVKAGARQPDGAFEAGSINALVDQRLRAMAERLREFPEFLLRGSRQESP
jgi:lon-related putative ATP-dependent protease